MVPRLLLNRLKKNKKITFYYTLHSETVLTTIKVYLKINHSWLILDAGRTAQVAANCNSQRLKKKYLLYIVYNSLWRIIEDKLIKLNKYLKGIHSYSLGHDTYRYQKLKQCIHTSIVQKWCMSYKHSREMIHVLHSLANNTIYMQV